MREKLIEFIWRCRLKCTNHLCVDCEKLADQFIANDVVPVVRCKDCKHCNNLFCYHPLQKYLGVYPEHFCSLGETIK